MSNETKVLCPSCEGEILPGMLYCWRHASGAPRVGGYRVDEGQLLWASIGCKGTSERALALLVEGEQVELRDVQEIVESKPARLAVDYAARDAAGGVGVKTGEIPLPRLFERLVEGTESVDADFNGA